MLLALLLAAPTQISNVTLSDAETAAAAAATLSAPQPRGRKGEDVGRALRDNHRPQLRGGRERVRQQLEPTPAAARPRSYVAYAAVSAVLPRPCEYEEVRR